MRQTVDRRVRRRQQKQMVGHEPDFVVRCMSSLNLTFMSSSLLRLRPPSFFTPTLLSCPVPRHRLLLSRLSLQFTPTGLPNATHRDFARFRGSNSSWRRPPRPDWLDSLDSKLIFYAIIAVNAGVYLAWTLAMQTYVRHTLLPRARFTNSITAHNR